MVFVLNYDGGYVVGVVMAGDDGYECTYPLRNFGDRQGDAKIFQQDDCPKLTIAQLRMLIRGYDRKVRYKRISGRRFVKC